jgi:hypothetical protein
MVFDQPPAIVQIDYDRGGNLGEYLRRYQTYRDQGTQVQITGICGSGCTLVTILPEKQVCTTFTARLVLHQATFNNGARNDLATRYLTGLYPDWVRARIVATPRGVLGPGYLVIGPVELAKHYRVCTQETIAGQ